jgi:hypothetical protein
MNEGRQAISELRDLVVLSEKRLEGISGWPFTLAARHELSSAIGRAFEIGAAYGRASMLEQQRAEYEANNATPSESDDYQPPPTPYIGHPARRRTDKGGNGAI